MENASKALLMAGGVLLAILVLSLMTYIFFTMGSNTKNFYDELDQSTISEFNQKFLNYEGRGTEANPDKPLNIQDVVTIVNLAKDNNEKGNLPTEVIVNVMLSDKSTSNWTTKDSNTLNQLLKDNMDKKYQCTEIKIDTNSELVCEVDISEF